MAKASRHDCVFIRKSTQAQDDQGQKSNVLTMLREIGVSVPDPYWFVGTVSRRKVKSNPEFNRLLELIETGSVRTVYVESQDRWGTSNREELFSLLAMLREHDTQLYDLRAKKDLTERDLATELLAFFGSVKSEKELQDLSYRSLRTRVNNFKERGSWPNGRQPFGFGKRCTNAAGVLLWEWHPTNRKLGQLYTPDTKGRLVPGQEGQRLPKKDKSDMTVLVPNKHKEYVKTVKLIFDLFTRMAMSRRQIAIRLNEQGRLFYDKPFNHTYITQILTNPAYAGHVHFGKTQSGELNTFDAKGMIVEVKRRDKKKSTLRAAGEQLVKKNAHPPLISPETWKLAQDKLKRESERKTFAPVNPAYYLRQILVCGHCGENVTGRTEIHPTTKERTVVYFCSSYMGHQAAGTESPCGAHRITHADAEKLLFDKIAERQLPFDEASSKMARTQLHRRMESLENEDAVSEMQFDQWIEDGVKALASYLRETYEISTAQINSLKKTAHCFYNMGIVPKNQLADMPLKWSEFREAVKAAEVAAVDYAKRKIATLKAKHLQVTRKFAKATEMMEDVLREDAARLEVEIALWQPRTVRLSERIKGLHAEDDQREVQRSKLLADWPHFEHRERAEALRRLFHTVTLYWDAEFRPAEENPSRPRKTERKGRFSYTLRKDLIEWGFGPDKLATYE